MTDASDTTLIIDDYARVTPIIQFASEASVQCCPSLNVHSERWRTNTHVGDMRRRTCSVLQGLDWTNVGCLSRLLRLTFVIYFINPCFMTISTIQPAAALPACAPPRRRSILLPERGQRGRGKAALMREAAIHAFLAGLPTGAAITLRDLLARVRLHGCADHVRAARAVMTAAGWQSPGPGGRNWTRGTAQ